MPVTTSSGHSGGTNGVGSNAGGSGSGGLNSETITMPTITSITSNATSNNNNNPPQDDGYPNINVVKFEDEDIQDEDEYDDKVFSSEDNDNSVQDMLQIEQGQSHGKTLHLFIDNLW